MTDPQATAERIALIDKGIQTCAVEWAVDCRFLLDQLAAREAEIASLQLRLDLSHSVHGDAMQAMKRAEAAEARASRLEAALRTTSTLVRKADQGLALRIEAAIAASPDPPSREPEPQA